MALPVAIGVKTETERFAGALNTYTIEAMMVTARLCRAVLLTILRQNFAKAFDVTFVNKENKLGICMG